MLHSSETEWTRTMHINPVATVESKKQGTGLIDRYIDW